MEKYLHIKPKFDCVITAGGEEFYLKGGIAQSFLLNSIDNIMPLRIYPISCNLIPYTLLLDLADISCDNPYIDIVDFGCDNILMYLSPLYRINYYGDCKKKYANFASKSHEISFYLHCPLSIRLECAGRYVDIKYHKEISTLDFVTSKNKIFIYCKIDSGYYVSKVSFSANGYKIESSKEVFLLEKDKKEITTLSPLFDSGQHGKVCHYNIDKDFEMTEEVVYMDEEVEVTSDFNLVPYCFMDAIKALDLRLARKYLSPALSSALDNAHLSTFFGDFLDIDSAYIDNGQAHVLSVIYENFEKEKSKKHGKIYSFKINDQGKIENIVEE